MAKNMPAISVSTNPIIRAVFTTNSILLYFFAPTFWLKNVSSVLPAILGRMYTKFSMLQAAALPAMTTVPRELMADWISTLVMPNILLCTAHGTPVSSISVRHCLFMASFSG